MRNLIEYPVTADECVMALQIALEQRNKNITLDEVGSIDGIAILMAEQFIAFKKEDFNKFVKGKFC